MLQRCYNMSLNTGYTFRLISVCPCVFSDFSPEFQFPIITVTLHPHLVFGVCWLRFINIQDSKWQESTNLRPISSNESSRHKDQQWQSTHSMIIEHQPQWDLTSWVKRSGKSTDNFFKKKKPKWPTVEGRWTAMMNLSQTKKSIKHFN